MIGSRFRLDVQGVQGVLGVAVLLAALAVGGWAGVRLILLAVYPTPSGEELSIATVAEAPLRWDWFRDSAMPAADVAGSARYQELDADTQLLGVVISDGESVAVIGTADGESWVLRIGDALREGVRVVAIEPRRVVLQAGAAQRQLTLRRLDGATGDVAAPPAITSAAVSDGVAPVWIQGSIVERVHDGEVIQVLVLGGVPQTALSLLGLERDDVVTAIDGSPVTAAGLLVAVQRAQSRGTKVSLTLQRGEQESTIEVEASTLGSMLLQRDGTPPKQHG